jgi:glycosyltransferase involved in cell wall biosynthesis
VKILVLEPAGRGGKAHYAFQLCRGLSNAGAEVTLLTDEDYELVMLCAPFTSEQSLRFPSARPRNVARHLRAFREWRRVLRRVSALRPDVILLGQLRSSADLLPLRQLRKHTRLLAGICHDPREHEGPVWKRIYAGFDFVFLHSESDHELARQRFGSREFRGEVIARGNEEIFSELADPTFSAAKLRGQLGLHEDEPIVLFFGSLSQDKGIDTLLRAFAAVHTRTGARLVIAGHPRSSFSLDAHYELTESLGIAGATVWIPESIPSEHVTAWMQLPSVLVVPYRDLAHGTAILLAQTYGVPVIASTAAAMSNRIEDGVTGLLVPPDDVPAWSDAIARLLEDRTLAQTLAANVRASATTLASWDTIGQTLLERFSAAID